MKSRSSTFFSLGISAALIAAGIWFLAGHHTWFGYGYGGGRWTMPHNMMMGGGMGIVMTIFWVVLIAALVLLISGTVNGRRTSEGRRDHLLDAIEILKARYARGEIDKSEFEAKCRDINTVKGDA